MIYYASAITAAKRLENAPAAPSARLTGIYRNCRSALQSLRANKTRSLLTSLGIIIGVGAVIVMISIGEASAASINSRLSGLNPTEIIIRSGSTGGARRGQAGARVLSKR